MSCDQPIPRSQFARRRLRFVSIAFIACVIFSLIVRYLDENLYNSSWFSGYGLGLAVLVLTAFHWRKKVPILPQLGSAAGWMQFHIYLGLTTFVAFGWHLHWKLPTGNFERLFALVYTAVGLSGVYGLYLTRSIPKRLAQIKRQFIYEQIPVLRFELRKRAQALVFDGGQSNEILARVYVNRVAQFLEVERSWLFARIPTGTTCRKLIGELVSMDRYLSSPQRETTRQLMNLVREKDDLDYHAALQGCLKTWAIVHVAMTYSLLTMMAVHLVLVHAFAGGWR